MNLTLKGEVQGEVDVFKYLAAILGQNRGVLGDVLNIVNEGAKVAGAMSKVWRVRSPQCSTANSPHASME